ncbi:protein TolQ [uncultured Mailhella sp.]|uniref:protein TolQ n=1 Tax=uncultured Mailhella sp. TaxID=1981031 RepID=UPI0025D1F917|nr:protein TolQ [uncultured Mailhella sp.]
MDYNIFSVFASASLVAQLIMVILIALSILSWTVIIGKIVTLSAAERKATAGIIRFTDAPDLRQAVQSLGGDPTSPLYGVAQHGVREFNDGKEAGADESVVVETVRRALNQGVGLEIDRLHKHLSILATAANTAPFIGLFGTVWGIMTSFHAIGQMKSASLATVAPGISEALIATAIGLGVAVPATIAYNMFLGKLDSIETRLINFAGIFLNRVQREVNVHRSRGGDR